MAADMYDAGPDLILPPNAVGIVPDVELTQLIERPTALAYVLEGDPGRTEWEHKFECSDAQAYAGSQNGRGVLVIVGSFDVSPLVGFYDTCEDK